jgi:hypothetical protein
MWTVRVKRIVVGVALLCAIALIYVISYSCLIHIGAVDYCDTSPHIHNLAWTSSDPAWNRAGFWFYWPCHTVTRWVYAGDFLYVTDEDDLRQLTAYQRQDGRRN